ncbi:hypothetical protein N7495_005961 [Penicillium taxi]|uniref:uncharacterized protein n=1 Tax=Penicillium taxi TaxID=168475 RepID=UPI002544E765|nr:uncharacterized protein N7495_005961 [Penicillium taxi]KAJ5894270.1 hypothetical protein N7495_005961 [Penicillium taxi]
MATKGLYHNSENSMRTVPASITLSAEQFERLYLTQMKRHQPPLAKQMRDPTPLGLRYHNHAPLILPHGLEGCERRRYCIHYLVGDLFSCVTFGTLGGYWFGTAASMMPSFNAAGQFNLYILTMIYTRVYYRLSQYIRYVELYFGIFHLTFLTRTWVTFLYLTMTIMILIFMICATRVHVVYFLIYLYLSLVYIMLTAGYWLLGEGNTTSGNRFVVGAGGVLFVSSLLGFYLLVVHLFAAVEFPFTLPVGDLLHS